MDIVTESPTIRVEASTSVSHIAGRVSGHLSERGGEIILRSLGAGAVNQALKGAIKARQFLAREGLDLIVKPGWKTVTGRDGEELSAVILRCMVMTGRP